MHQDQWFKFYVSLFLKKNGFKDGDTVGRYRSELPPGWILIEMDPIPDKPKRKVDFNGILEKCKALPFLRQRKVKI